MTLVIGTDEAGYGPNLGPLVVAATAWNIAAGPDEAEACLAGVVETLPTVRGGRSSGPLWADSKQVYRGAGGFAAVERAACAGVAIAAGRMPRSWQELADSLGAIHPAPEPATDLAIEPVGSPRDAADRVPADTARSQWGGLEALSLPLEAAADECADLAAAIGPYLLRHSVSLERIACRCLYPREFNTLLASGLNKSDILSAVTLELAAGLRRLGPDEPAVVWCDRHGGRKRYGGLVARHFHAPLVQPLEEMQDHSAYLVPAAHANAAARIEFCVGGEARVPVALASLTAKYVREVVMHAFNAHWCGLVPGLAPTAGYPVDAARWRREAADLIGRAGIPDDDVWRRA
ncbi:MAG: hypothetical protein ACKOTB_12530 [Planctomycetia bacterium]